MPLILPCQISLRMMIAGSSLLCKQIQVYLWGFIAFFLIRPIIFSPICSMETSVMINNVTPEGDACSCSVQSNYMNLNRWPNQIAYPSTMQTATLDQSLQPLTIWPWLGLLRSFVEMHKSSLTYRCSRSSLLHISVLWSSKTLVSQTKRAEGEEIGLKFKRGAYPLQSKRMSILSVLFDLLQ